MNERFTQQELTALLAQRHGMELADAEAFVRMLFACVEKAILSDKYVKVKGLGTFKVIGADEGEACGVRRLFRIVFTPDPSMRGQVNKPFVHFETVVLNDSTHFDDMDEPSVAEYSPADGTDMEDGCREDVPASEEDTAGMEHMAIPADGAPSESPAADDVFQAASEDAPGTEETAPQLGSGKTRKVLSEKLPGLPWCMVATVLFVGIIVGGWIAWGMFSGRRYLPEPVVRHLMESVRQSVASADKQPARAGNPLKAGQEKDTASASASSTVSAASAPAASDAKKSRPVSTAKSETLADTAGYAIAGTKASHTLKPGESLVKLALKFYGDKKLWPYIARHNRKTIKDANNVPVGTVVLIPKLVPKK